MQVLSLEDKISIEALLWTKGFYNSDPHTREGPNSCVRS